MTRRTLLLLGFVALLVIFTSWLSRESTSPAQTPTSANAHQPDYFIVGLESTITDINGKPSHQLTAETLYHYPDNDISELTQPDITVFGEDGERWHATAETGHVEGEQNQLTLRGDVLLKQQAAEELDLKTDWLRIDTGRHYAETDAAVTLLGPSTRVEGVGMKVYGKEQRMHILSSVRGSYAAN